MFTTNEEEIKQLNSDILKADTVHCSYEGNNTFTICAWYYEPHEPYRSSVTKEQFIKIITYWANEKVKK